MQKLLSLTNPNHHSSFAKEEDKPEVLTTDIFHFKIDQLQCFIIMGNFDKTKDCGYYNAFFIHNTSKKIFEFDVELNIEEFDSSLYEYLKTKVEHEVAELFIKHGYMSVSRNIFRIDILLKKQGVGTIPSQILDLLDDSAIQTLATLQLGIIPKIYNWLAEVDGAQKQCRIKALLDYPILLVSLVTPTIYMYYPDYLNDVEQNDDDEEDENLLLSQRIDNGEPIESILSELLDIPFVSLMAIKGKIFKDVTQKTNPKVYTQFRKKIESYQQLANF